MKIGTTILQLLEINLERHFYTSRAPSSSIDTLIPGIHLEFTGCSQA